MPRRLRITQIVTRLDRGGAADVVIALCERLNRARFDVALVTGPSAEPAEEPRAIADRLGIRVAECADLVRPVAPVRDVRAALALSRHLRAHQPDVVHTHTSKAGALSRIAAQLAGGITLIHSPHGHLFYGYYGRLGTGLVVLAERTLAPLADRIAVLTQVERDEHLDRGVGRFEQYVVIPSGIDLARFRRDEAARIRLRRELGLERAFVVGWVGRFVRVKGPDVFAAAAVAVAEEVPEAAFVFAGDGELRAETESRMAAAGLTSRCRFLGHRSDVAAVLNACDVYVLPSRNEGLGLSAVEAMACGKPVVAASVGGVGELLQHGRAGLLVPAEDAGGVARAVVALAKDPPRREALARAGLVRARDFDVATMVDRFSEVYEELAGACSAML